MRGQQYLDRFMGDSPLEGKNNDGKPTSNSHSREKRKKVPVKKSQHSRNLKHKLFKNGTLRIACKGSKHLVWERDVKPERIKKCLDRFCWDCGIVECERSGRRKRGKSQK